MTDLRKKLPCTVDVLGTGYSACFRDDSDPNMTGCGYCNYREKILAIKPQIGKSKLSKIAALHLECEELRHEVIHAYLYESGLGYDSLTVNQWAINEEMIDWLAMQLPKIFKTYKELGIL